MASLAPPAVPTPADAGSAASSAVAAGSGGAGAGAAAQAAKPDATASANGAPVSVSASSSLAAALMAPLKTGAGGGDAAGQPRSNGSDPADGDASAVGGRVDPSGSAALAGNSGSANGSTGSGAQTAGGDGAATASANGGGGSNLKAHPSPEAAGASKPASSSAAGDGAAGLKVRTKSRGSTLNPAAAEFTPVRRGGRCLCCEGAPEPRNPPRSPPPDPTRAPLCATDRLAHTPVTSTVCYHVPGVMGAACGRYFQLRAAPAGRTHRRLSRPRCFPACRYRPCAGAQQHWQHRQQAPP